MRILLAELHPGARYALTVLLNGQPGWETIGFAVSADEVLEKAAALQPDLILLDEQIYESAPQAFEVFCGRSERPRVVVIGTDPGREGEIPGLAVDRFFSKMESSEKLLEMLRDCAREPMKHRPAGHRRRTQNRFIAL